jgi:pimeloyl-ACP methyl ester carboxylesterase
MGIDENSIVMKKFVMLENASHFLHHEHPDKFNYTLLDWLKST